MSLSRPNQQLRRKLQEIARLSGDVAHTVLLMAKTLPDSQAMALMHAIGLVYECVDKVNALAGRVKAGSVQAVS